MRARGATLRAESGSRFTAPNGRALEFHGDGRLRVVDAFGSVDVFERVPAPGLESRPLVDYPGEYASDEAEVSMTVAVENDAVFLRRRADASLRLMPLSADAFRGPIGFVRFHRDAQGMVSGFSISQDRVWALRFTRRSSAGNQRPAR